MKSQKSSSGTAVTVKFTAVELRVLTALAGDQLFRREFIDPKMPGHRADPEGLRIGKHLVERLRKMTERPSVVLLARIHERPLEKTRGT
jgi:hypothetical protein